MSESELRLLLAEKLVLLSQLVVIDMVLRRGIDAPYLRERVQGVLDDIQDTRERLLQLKAVHGAGAGGLVRGAFTFRP